MIGPIIAAIVGYKLGEKYLPSADEVPLGAWAIEGNVSKPVMTLTRFRCRGKKSYRLYVVTNGNSMKVGEAPAYPQILGVMQHWQKYLAEGGTVEAWLANNTRRAQEIAALEEVYQQ